METHELRSIEDLLRKGSGYMPFYFCPLRSGSSGNSLFVQAGTARVLVDAGLSGRAVERALAELDIPADSLSGILISHEHTDHVQGVGVLSRRYDLPVYATEGTWAAISDKPAFAAIPSKNIRVFSPGEDFYIRDLAVSPFSIPHDAANPVGFSLLYGGRKVCVATDLGHIASGWMQALAGADLVLLEANHDVGMLRSSTRYHAGLKSRILGKHGHLSNADSGQALAKLVETGVHHVVLGHMSAESNTPDLARQTVCAALRDAGIRPDTDVRVDLAWRDHAGNLYEIG